MAPGAGVDPACQGKTFRLHRCVKKGVRDTVDQEVQAHHSQYFKGKRTFRASPGGETAAQTSLRVKGLAVLLYLSG